MPSGARVVLGTGHDIRAGGTVKFSGLVGVGRSLKGEFVVSRIEGRVATLARRKSTNKKGRV
jgi:hypothetical protein